MVLTGTNGVASFSEDSFSIDGFSISAFDIDANAIVESVCIIARGKSESVSGRSARLLNKRRSLVSADTWQAGLSTDVRKQSLSLQGRADSIHTVQRKKVIGILSDSSAVMAQPRIKKQFIKVRYGCSN